MLELPLPKSKLSREMTPSISSMHFPAASCVVNHLCELRSQILRQTPICCTRPPGYPSQHTLAFAKPLGLLLLSRIAEGGETGNREKDNVRPSGRCRREQGRQSKRVGETARKITTSYVGDAGTRRGGCDRVCVRGILWLSMNKKHKGREQGRKR